MPEMAVDKALKERGAAVEGIDYLAASTRPYHPELACPDDEPAKCVLLTVKTCDVFDAWTFKNERLESLADAIQEASALATLSWPSLVTGQGGSDTMALEGVIPESAVESFSEAQGSPRSQGLPPVGMSVEPAPGVQKSIQLKQPARPWESSIVPDVSFVISDRGAVLYPPISPRRIRLPGHEAGRSDSRNVTWTYGGSLSSHIPSAGLARADSHLVPADQVTQRLDDPLRLLDSTAPGAARSESIPSQEQQASFSGTQNAPTNYFERRSVLDQLTSSMEHGIMSSTATQRHPPPALSPQELFRQLVQELKRLQARLTTMKQTGFDEHGIPATNEGLQALLSRFQHYKGIYDRLVQQQQTQ